MESPFRIGMGYQENYLTLKHLQLGFEVHVISTSDGLVLPGGILGCPPFTHITSEGMHIHYLAKNPSVLRKIPFVVGWTHVSIGLSEKIGEIHPDIIFVHGICKIDNKDVIDYCESHDEVQLYADNHSDYYNTPVTSFREKSFRYGVGRYIGKRLNNRAKRIWGVSPWRITYQQDVYGIKPEKSALLVMGGDEDTIKWDTKQDVRHQIRQRYGIPDSAFVLITGGKIDRAKNIHLLIDAIVKTASDAADIHLFVFGRYEKDMEVYAQSIKDERIHNIGWISPNEANDYFLASDLACFPGTHSVLWEQSCACGCPAIFKDWDGGFAHVDVGGNCVLLKEISTESLKNLIFKLSSKGEDFERMKNIAGTNARKVFSYIDIAKRSIEMD